MIIETEEHKDKIISDDDFFSAFEEPKEEFEQKEISEEEEKFKKDFLDNDKPKLLTYADKLNISDFFVTTVTNYIDDLANNYSGVNEKGRYMPSKESREEIKKSLAKLLPDWFKIPEWLKLAFLIFLAYQPIVKKVKKDSKNDEEES